MASIEDILMIKGPDVIIAPSSSTVLDAARLMSEANVGSVIVKNDEEVVGIFTERDLLKRVMATQRDPSTTLLSDVMSTPVKSCRLDDQVRKCTNVLTEDHFRHMAVIEDGALIGLVGLRDVMAAELREAGEKIRALEKLLEDRQ